MSRRYVSGIDITKSFAAKGKASWLKVFKETDGETIAPSKA